MIDTQCSNARVHAVAILEAWGSNNPAVLHQNLVSAVQGAQTPVADTGESERLEILAAIAIKMRTLLESDELNTAEQFLPLLRHLAAPPPGYYEYAYSC